MDFDWALRIPGLTELHARTLARRAVDELGTPFAEVINPLNQLSVTFDRRELEALDAGLSKTAPGHVWRRGIGEILSDPDFVGEPGHDDRFWLPPSGDLWDRARLLPWDLGCGDFSQETMSALAARSIDLFALPATVLDPHQWNQVFYRAEEIDDLLAAIDGSPRCELLARLRQQASLWREIHQHVKASPPSTVSRGDWGVKINGLDELGARRVCRRLIDEEGISAFTLNPFDNLVLRPSASESASDWEILLPGATEDDARRALTVAREELTAFGTTVNPGDGPTMLLDVTTATELVRNSANNETGTAERVSAWLEHHHRYAVDVYL